MGSPRSPFSGPLTWNTRDDFTNVVANVIRRKRDPLPTDRQYPIGQLWINVPEKTGFILTNVSASVAFWKPLALGPTDLEKLEGNTGGEVFPTGSKINIVGDTSTGIIVDGDPATSTLTVRSQLVPAETLTGDTGGPITPTLGNFNIVGDPLTGIVVDGDPATSTLTISLPAPPFFFEWLVVTDDTTMDPNKGYILDSATDKTLTLPLTAEVGTTLAALRFGAGKWTLAQNAGQNVRFGSNVTTTGTGGDLESQDQGDGVWLVCVVADTSWMVISSQGNITGT